MQVYLTHDIDELYKEFYFYLKNSIGSVLSMNLSQIKNIFLKEDFYNIEEIIDIEKEFNVKSTFFIYSKINNDIRNPQYDISKEEKFNQTMESIAKRGWKIGLHGGVKSKDNHKLMKQEKEKLESIYKIKVNRLRQHWLSYKYPTTLKIAKSIGITKEFSVGSNVKSGIPNYNIISGIKSIPTALMDITMLRYNNKEKNSLKSTIQNVLDDAEEKDVDISVDWHNKSFSKTFNWESQYRYILEYLEKNEICVCN